MAIVVLLSRPFSKVKLWWAVSCLCVFGWAVSIGRETSEVNFENALILVQWVNLFGILIPTAFLHTVAQLLDIRRPRLLGAISLFTFFLIAIDASGHLSIVRPFPPFHFYNARLWPYDLFVIHFYTVFLIAEMMLWQAFKNSSDPRKKAQLRTLLMGIGLGVLGGQTSIPMVYNINFYPIGVPFVSAYVLIIAWGMFRYQLMDFKLVLRRLSSVAIIYLATGGILLPFTWPSFRSLSALNSNVRIVAVTCSIALSIFLVSGPAVYVLLIRKSRWLQTFLSSGFSHDIRSPLASIESAADMIRAAARGHESVVDRSRILEYANMIERNVLQLNQFSAGMLALLKQETDQGHPKTRIDLNQAIIEIIGGMEIRLAQKSLAVDVQIESSLSVEANTEGFRSIVSNVLWNAIRHSESGTISVAASIEKDEVVISVRDQGEGLRAGTASKIFEPYYQGKNKRGGAGLGLTIARNWVEAQGGRIWAESEGEKRGTIVKFTLPFARQP